MIEQVFWLVEGRVLVFRLTGPLTLEGLKECDAVTVRMIAAEGKPPFVNVVYDLRMADEPELSLMNMNAMRKSVDPQAHQGWTIIVAPKPNPIMESIASIILQILRLRLRVMTNYDEALRFLFEMDTSLPPLPSDASTR